jgi:hypothetical protein
VIPNSLNNPINLLVSMRLTWTFRLGFRARFRESRLPVTQIDFDVDGRAVEPDDGTTVHLGKHQAPPHAEWRAEQFYGIPLN